jgi:hypothetical protein
MAAVKNLDKISITTEIGREVPAQFRALAKWPDGSIRWVLCDFQADVKSDGSTKYYLVSKPHRKYKSPLRTEETDDCIIVSTGMMEFKISKIRQTILEQVKLNKKILTEEPSGFICGTQKSVDMKPLSVKVVEYGPMRVCVRAEGLIADGLLYTAWIHAFKGKSYVRVNLILKNHGGRNRNIPNLSIGTKLTGKKEFVYIHNNKNPEEKLSNRKFIFSEEENKATGGWKNWTSGGSWVDLTGPAGGLSLGMLYFNENKPKKFAVHKDGQIRLDIFPDPPKFRGGLHKSHELYYYFHSAQVKPEDIKKQMLELAYPLQATALPSWYRDTMAIPGGFIPVKDQTKWSRWEGALTTYDKWRPGGPAPGASSDWKRGHVRPPGKGTNWANFGLRGWDDIDTPYGEMAQYLRNPDHPIGLLEMGRIFTHGCINLKMMHRHNNHKYLNNYRDWRNLEHFGGRGWLLYYLITGDEYALEGARELAEGARGKNGHTGIPYWTQRGWARGIKLFTELYEVTGDEGYLDSARLFINNLCQSRQWRGDVHRMHSYVWQVAFLINGTAKYCWAARLAGRQDYLAERYMNDMLRFIAGTPLKSSNSVGYSWKSGRGPWETGKKTLLYGDGFAFAYFLDFYKKDWLEMAHRLGPYRGGDIGNKKFHWRQGHVWRAVEQGITCKNVFGDTIKAEPVTGIRIVWQTNYETGLRWAQGKTPLGVIGYRVYRSEKSDFNPNKTNFVGESKYEEFNDATISNRVKKYYYKIALIDAAGNEGPLSKPFEVKVPVNTAPLMTARVGASPRAKSILVFWKNSLPQADITGVNIYRSEKPDSKFKPIASKIKSLYYLDKQVKIGKRYYYKIKLVDRGGLSSVFSKVVSSYPVKKTEPYALRLNYGGPEYTDKQENVWQAVEPPKGFWKANTEKPVKGGNDDAIYKTVIVTAHQPNLTFTYKDISPGVYKVKLFFSGIAKQPAFSPTFDLFVDNKFVEKICLKKKPGLMTAYKKVANNYPIFDGNLKVTLLSYMGRGEMSGLSIEGVRPVNPGEGPTVIESKKNPDRSKTLAYNCGGGAFKDKSGVEWRADQAFNGHWGYTGKMRTRTREWLNRKKTKKTEPPFNTILSTTPIKTSKIKRWQVPGFKKQQDLIGRVLAHGKELSYRIKVDNGRYRVRLYLPKYEWEQRKFYRIIVQNQLLMVNPGTASSRWPSDMIAGSKMTYNLGVGNEVKTFDGVTVSNGKFSVDLLADFTNDNYAPGLSGITLEKIED